MSIERGNDEMQTTKKDRGQTTRIFTGEAGSLLGDAVDVRARRLLAEAVHERQAGHRHGLRHRLGHALIALGRSIHGMEPEHATRSAVHSR